jgi:hypothetical protein
VGSGIISQRVGMTFPREDAIERRATNVWKTIRVEEQLKLTLEEFTVRVDQTKPKRNYTPDELALIFEKLKNDLFASRI